MKKTIGLVTFLLALAFQISPTLAQIRGAGSSDFFDEGQEQMETEVEEMERERDAKEAELEQNLQINQEDKPQAEEKPENSDSLDENIPEGEEQEVEVKF